MKAEEKRRLKRERKEPGSMQQRKLK